MYRVLTHSLVSRALNILSVYLRPVCYLASVFEANFQSYFSVTSCNVQTKFHVQKRCLSVCPRSVQKHSGVSKSTQDTAPYPRVPAW